VIWIGIAGVALFVAGFAAGCWLALEIVREARQ
jgi:hypothetical protein